MSTSHVQPHLGRYLIPEASGCSHPPAMWIWAADDLQLPPLCGELTSTNRKLAYCWRWCPASKYRDNQWAWMSDMEIHNPSPQSCDLHFMTLSRVTSLFGSFSMPFLFPSLLKGFPEGHYPQQILQTHIFTSGSAFSGSPDKYQLLAATASIYLLQPWRSCLFCCHSCEQHITPAYGLFVFPLGQI